MYLVFAHSCAVGLGGDCLSSNSSLTTILLSFFPTYSHPKRQVDTAPLLIMVAFRILPEIRCNDSAAAFCT
jgi:hypothetical protein